MAGPIHRMDAVSSRSTRAEPRADGESSRRRRLVELVIRKSASALLEALGLTRRDLLELRALQCSPWVYVSMAAFVVPHAVFANVMARSTSPSICSYLQLHSKWPALFVSAFGPSQAFVIMVLAIKEGDNGCSLASLLLGRRRSGADARRQGSAGGGDAGRAGGADEEAAAVATWDANSRIADRPRCGEIDGGVDADAPSTSASSSSRCARWKGPHDAIATVISGLYAANKSLVRANSVVSIFSAIMIISIPRCMYGAHQHFVYLSVPSTWSLMLQLEFVSRSPGRIFIFLCLLSLSAIEYFTYCYCNAYFFAEFIAYACCFQYFGMRAAKLGMKFDIVEYSLFVVPMTILVWTAQRILLDMHANHPYNVGSIQGEKPLVSLSLHCHLQLLRDIHTSGVCVCLGAGPLQRNGTDAQR